VGWFGIQVILNDLSTELQGSTHCSCSI